MVIEDKFNVLKSSLSYRAFQHFIASVDQTHIYLFVSGIFIGFLIGIQFKQNLKPLTRMRALVCNSYKGAESISMTDDVIAPNSCGAEEVLIQVKASSIDPMDIKITLGYGKVIRSQYHHYNKVKYKSILILYLFFKIKHAMRCFIFERHMEKICSFLLCLEESVLVAS